MGQKITVIDAFTDKVFGGNPAAVCVLDTDRDDTWMQALAREMNLSETAFLLPKEDDWSLRWFTPAEEVELCGHATLASSHHLWESGRLSPDAPARFHTLSGVLTSRRRGDWIEMDFPATPPEVAPPPSDLTQALGADPVYVGKTVFDFLIELADEDTVRNLAPDFGVLKTYPERGVIVTARAASPDSGYDFVSRCFAPRLGIDEDPVTGSAHCALGPFWGERMKKTELAGFQASERGGTVRVQLQGDRALLLGKAITVWKGELA